MKPFDIDINYVDGYSVPIICSFRGTAVAGCNINLFKQAHVICINKVESPVCLNSAQTVPNSSALSFFTACAEAAYTYPKNDKANVSNLKSNLISCCIDLLCKAPLKQKR